MPIDEDANEVLANAFAMSNATDLRSFLEGWVAGQDNAAEMLKWATRDVKKILERHTGSG